MSQNALDKYPKTTIAQLFDMSIKPYLCWQNFQTVFSLSPLRKRVRIDIEKYPAYVVYCFLAHASRKNLSAEEMATLQTLACMVYMLPDIDPDIRISRNNLMYRAFQSSSSLEPMLIHYFTDNLVNLFQQISNSTECMLNIATFISRETSLGLAVAVCLMWSIIFRSNGSDVEIHQFHDLTELIGILSTLRIEDVKPRMFYNLMHSIGSLLHLTLCNKWQELFRAHGYPANYFRLRAQDARRLQAWVEKADHYYRGHTKLIGHRIRNEASKVMGSLQYLESNSSEWCLICHSRSTYGVCVLGQINNRFDCTKV
ncbi:uncharacterized protein LOC133848421 [Drosophila sulfurigaster albostrigata]|uniref:uncharacterized protein LOC133848421 n=1 Tax=Drosophila sulfurigaster albostrigata TaxID=89887 RepID=UPI002D219A31|nr:uncharacterized protein LOC133848421 [Drosophila sulfurigaster albostrigata]